MCGIAGWLGPFGTADDAAQMLRRLHHRGPDGHGLKMFPDATLVHTRLNIIDLSPTGAQPMANEDQRIWVVFNGEIYNHRELRRDLESHGHRFNGRSDTEILPHLYEEYGSDFASKLRGMFALAIYDAQRRTLTVARDRFGIKPLFYASAPNRFAFASELGALVGLPGIDTRPDKQAISDFAALCYIPAPETFYTGIRALEPGHILEARFSGNGVSCKIRRYHRWSIAPEPSLRFEEAVGRADALLSAAVGQQLQSDVPLGALLSGGIDSSLVSAAAQQALGGGLRTFNVRFAEAGFDETWAALAVARTLGTRHETLDMEHGGGTWDRVAELLSHAGQPFADTSIFAVNAICRMMRRNVTVALSGDGGDEGFGGYDIYWRIARIAQWRALPGIVGRGICASLAPMASLGFISRRAPRRLQELAGADDTAVVQSLFSWLSDQERERLFRDRSVLPVRRLFEPRWDRCLPKHASPVERLSAHATEVNTRLTLPNDFLFKVDLASMKESLEVRVPMLDEDLFAFGLSLPHHLKAAGRTCKRILRTLAARKFPAEVAQKPKSGFAVPVDSWVDAHFKAKLSEFLLGPSSKLEEFFEPSVYKPVATAFCKGRFLPGVPREKLYQMTIMLLSVNLALCENAAQRAMLAPAGFSEGAPLSLS